MKKILLFVMATAAIVAAMSSCEKETVLSVNQTALSFKDGGGEETVTLTANKAWTASAGQTWCKVTPSGGEEAAGSRITIKCDANTTYDERSCTVTFTCAEKTVSVNVTQATNQGLVVGQTSFELTKAAQQIEIPVQANVKFSVEVAASCKDWITYKTTKGLTSSTVVLDIAENKTYDSREGKVTIKQDGGSLSSTIDIKQTQLDGLFITTPEYDLSNESHTLTVEVSTNVAFDVTSGADWVKYVETKGLQTKQIILQVAANETYDARETQVAVKQKNGSLSGTVTIRQDEKYGLMVSKSEFDLSSDAQTFEVEVRFNVNYDIVIPEACKDWIKLVSTKGLSEKTCTFSVAKNEAFDPREGSITFKQKDGPLSGTVAVRQEQSYGLFVDPKSFEVSGDGGKVEFNITANVDYVVEPQVDWITVFKTKGLQTDKYVLEVAPSDSREPRKGTVTIRQENGKLNESVEILQGPSILLQERDILIEFYKQLDGPNWSHSDNWCSDKPLNRWYGVQTNAYGRVSSIILSYNGLKGTIPESIGDLEDLTYLHLGVNYEISGSIPESIGKLANLTTLALFENKLTGTIPESIMNLDKLTLFYIYQNRLDGTLPEKLYYSDWWVSRYFRMDQQEGYGLKFESIYESTDYSRHGEVKQIQQHTKGPGLIVAITADGFSDRMIADGKFDMVVNQAVEAFFEEEPYKSFREYFDVYSIAAVSKNEIIDYDYAFETRIKECGRMYGIEINAGKVNSFFDKYLNIQKNKSYITTLVLVNKNNGCVGPFTYMYTDDSALTVAGAGDRENVKHETAGHGFGKLADEYYCDVPAPENLHEVYHKRGWYLNVDDTNDPSKVLWKDFLTDPYYQAEGIGIYQGALYNNWYKSTSSSIMLGGSDGFNAPSRWAIYQRIKKLAGEECSFEEFLKYDKNRTVTFNERMDIYSPAICNYPSRNTGKH